MKYRMKYITIRYLFFLFFLVMYCFHCEANIKYFKDALQNIALTDTNSYVGAKNFIIKLDNDLNIIKQKRTGPKKDNPRRCYREVCEEVTCLLGSTKQDVDNFNQILLITDELLKSDSLLTCGSIFTGQCNYRSLDTLDVKDVKSLCFESVSANLPNATTVAVPSKDGKTLYVAKTLTYNLLQPTSNSAFAARNLVDNGKLQSLSSRKVSNSKDEIFVNKKAFKEELVNSLRVYKSSFPVYYTSAYSSEKGVYFTTIQGQNLSAPALSVSRLIRITPSSDGSKYFEKYIENTVACQHGGIRYNILLSMSIVDVKKVHSELGDFKKGDKIVFGVFAQANVYKPYPRMYQKYAICQFTMSSINNHFDDTIKSCNTAETPTVPTVSTLESRSCGPFVREFVSYAPSDVIYGNVLRTEETFKYQSIFAYEHTRGISVFVTSNGHSVTKFAVVKDKDDMKLHEYNKKTFTNDGNDQSMFFKILLDQYKSSLFLMSKHHVAKVPLVDCSSRSTCNDCLRGPSCGWCTLYNRCTMETGCPNYTKQLHFVTQNASVCPSSTIKHTNYSVGECAEISLVASNLPEDVDLYQCQIGPAFIPLTRNGSVFKCDSFDFIDIHLDEKKGELSVTVSISLEVSGKHIPVVTSTITVYRCPTFKTCDQCITGKYQCGWCANEMKCKKVGGGCSNWIPHKGYGSNMSSNICPRLVNSNYKMLPSGDKREITLNVERFPQPTLSLSYACLLTIPSANNKIIITKAVWKNSSIIVCQKEVYSFSDDYKHDSMEGIFSVSYGDAIIDSSAIKVELYKCYKIQYCSVCMKAFGGYCGWCGKPQECRLNETCGVSVAVSSCPNPVIDTFTPTKASVKAPIKVVIKGNDLGSERDLKYVKVAGKECTWKDQTPHKSITCSVEPVDTEVSGVIQVAFQLNGVSATSKTNFSFVNPKVLSFKPKSGPCSGGTKLTVNGKDFDVGNNVSVSVGELECNVVGPRTSESLTCETKSAANSAKSCQKSQRKRRSTGKEFLVCINFGGDSGNRVCGSKEFQYDLDPLINSVYTNKETINIVTYASGGQIINVKGKRLSLVQDPKLMFTVKTGNKTDNFFSPCKYYPNRDIMQCSSPNISRAFTGNKSDIYTIGFKMGNMVNLESFKEITVVPDPVFYPFAGNVFQSDFENLDLSIKASHLTALSKKDVRVEIAGASCKDVGFVGTGGSHRLICTMPSLNKLEDQNRPFSVKVIVGQGGLTYDIGTVAYFVKDQSDTLYISLAAAAGVVVILIVIVSILLYRRRHLRDKKDYHKDLQLHMDKIESQYARECKEAFAEYQIERSDLTSDVNQEYAPRREFRQFAMRVLYPGLESHPILEPNKDDREEWETCMLSFIDLLKDKDFILTFVRTLEGQSTFQMPDRCIVASLLMVSLQDDIVFVTEILQELLTDLINKAGSSKRPKLLLRRTESIAEKLLTNWLAYTLFDFLSDVVGDPLFSLFTAVNILLDREPADAITFDAKNSLSEDKLLRTKIDFKILTINIEYVNSSKFGGVYEGISVLSTDTISQVKEKIVKHIYKNQPHSLRPLPDDLQLGHVSTSGAIRNMKDSDASNLVEGEWKKLNTLGYILNLHKIPDCAMLRLTHNAEALSANGSAMMDDSLPNVTFHSSISSTPMLYDCGGQEPKLYHLVKPTDSDFAKDDVRQSKMMAEVYLTRLLKTKETLGSFVNQLFKAIFGSSEYESRVIPPSIKFLFDFLDSQAEKMDIEDSDVHHTWKNNSLPLRFWINMIKNPDFVFDIRKSNTVDSCLSVIAQLFMDSCSPDEHRLGKDSPSNKLLYAKEIPGYKKEVKRFYTDVKDSIFEEKEFYAKLEEISSLYGKSFNSCNAAYELMTYAVKYKVKLMDNLEDNGSAEDAEKLQEIMENLPDD